MRDELGDADLDPTDQAALLDVAATLHPWCRSTVKVSVDDARVGWSLVSFEATLDGLDVQGERVLVSFDDGAISISLYGDLLDSSPLLESNQIDMPYAGGCVRMAVAD
jgi:hypothetical protein